MKASAHNYNNITGKKSSEGDAFFRKTTQYLMPSNHTPTPPGVYDIYPGFDIGSGKIDLGFNALAQKVSSHSTVIIDGYQGVLWEDFRGRLDRELKALGIAAHWEDVSSRLRPEECIEEMVKPFLGGDDPLFGTRYTGVLDDFFDMDSLRGLRPDIASRVTILYGTGAALAGWRGYTIYVDIPKNEIQFRSRAGRVCNLGQKLPESPKPQYKRSYFVDWVVLNIHKARLLPTIDLVVDGQRPDEPAMARGVDVRRALSCISTNWFRVRPWFEPGPWGGHWILEHIPGLSPHVPNYAWSFELIVPENGLLLESDHTLLELSFDFLMFQEYRNVLGDFAERFKYEFPIRYDFLDTFGGGNLSIQCHPRAEYIRERFGETFTQDEAYYILDCKPGSGVYIGFKEGVDTAEFREVLAKGYSQSSQVDIDRYVNFEKANKHDLFLIPCGTIHGSGVDNLVLEISSTPYIFTFKMYDWLRADLDGQPRPINIDRAFDNLLFQRQGEVIRQEHIARPRIVDSGADWSLVHMPTHPDHFYDIHRYEFSTMVEFKTGGSPQVMNLVEGQSVILETESGLRQRFNYAETFVVPAAVNSCRLISENGQPVRVVKTFLKKGVKV